MAEIKKWQTNMMCNWNGAQTWPENTQQEHKSKFFFQCLNCNYIKIGKHWKQTFLAVSISFRYLFDFTFQYIKIFAERVKYI